MVIDAMEVERATVLFLAGELDSDSCVQVREIVARLITDGRRFLVLDLSGIERMYTAGLFALLDLQRTAERTGGRLVCSGGRPFIRELMRITMIDRALDLQTDLDTALDLARAAS